MSQEDDRFKESSSMALTTFMNREGIDSAWIAATLGISTDLLGGVRRGKTITQAEIYAGLYLITGMAEFDPRTLPPRVYVLPNSQTSTPRAWTEDEWEAWKSSKDALRIMHAANRAKEPTRRHQGGIRTDKSSRGRSSRPAPTVTNATTAEAPDETLRQTASVRTARPRPSLTSDKKSAPTPSITIGAQTPEAPTSQPTTPPVYQAPASPSITIGGIMGYWINSLFTAAAAQLVTPITQQISLNKIEIVEAVRNELRTALMAALHTGSEDEVSRLTTTNVSALLERLNELLAPLVADGAEEQRERFYQEHGDIARRVVTKLEPLTHPERVREAELSQNRFGGQMLAREEK